MKIKIAIYVLREQRNTKSQTNTSKLLLNCMKRRETKIMVKTKPEAKESLEEIKQFLKENLELELNKKTQIFKNKQGVNFCGYKINAYRMKLRDKGKSKTFD